MLRAIDRASWVLVGALGLLVVAMLAGRINAGSLDPPGAPASTMKSLSDIRPVWDQVLPVATRFRLVMSGAAVADNETGLVWAPAQEPPDVWASANLICLTKTLGQRNGWRLPTMEELESLVDPTTTNPAFPAGAPFTAPSTSTGYWTATTVHGLTNRAYDVNFGGSGGFGEADKTLNTMPFWCVRGEQGLDGR